MALPALLRTRIGLSRHVTGQLVSDRQDGAGERAGGQRPLLAAPGCRGRKTRPRTVVLEDHRLRGPAARRPRALERLAGARAHHAGQLARPIARRRGWFYNRWLGRRAAAWLHDAT